MVLMSNANIGVLLEEVVNELVIVDEPINNILSIPKKKREKVAKSIVDFIKDNLLDIKKKELSYIRRVIKSYNYSKYIKDYDTFGELEKDNIFNSILSIVQYITKYDKVRNITYFDGVMIIEPITLMRR